MNFRSLSASLLCAALSLAAFEPTKALAATKTFQVDVENLDFIGTEGVRKRYGLGLGDSLTAYLQFDIDQTTGFTTTTRRSLGTSREVRYIYIYRNSPIERFVVDTPNGRIENTDGFTGGSFFTVDNHFISDNSLSGFETVQDQVSFKDHGSSTSPGGWARLGLRFDHTLPAGTDPLDPWDRGDLLTEDVLNSSWLRSFQLTGTNPFTGGSGWFYSSEMTFTEIGAIPDNVPGFSPTFASVPLPASLPVAFLTLSGIWAMRSRGKKAEFPPVS